jgi:predicted GNAT family N-acyltransferase
MLRKSANWPAIEETLAQKGLEHSAFLIVANDNSSPIGMARVITDYGYTVYIADVIVLPDYQGKGLGREIMSQVMAYIDENIAPGHGKFITLMAAKGKEDFYLRFGFIKRPNDNYGCGMSQWIQKEKPE